ncbi:MAG: PBSX family phage terminase large subunit [Rhodanobacteraceae bacterium]
MGRALDIDMPLKMLPFLQPMRHKVAHGGRGGGKSHSVARLLIAKAIDRPTRWLCTREIQKSIKDSVHKLLADTIKSMNVGYHFDVQETTIKAHNGGEFLFSGLQAHTVDSIKSFEGCDGAWIEEAHSVVAASANVLIPTIRKAGSELWWTYNPNNEGDYVHDKFVVKKSPNALVVEINYRDNPWFPAELEMERLELKAINDDLYQHVWEGKCKSLAGLLFKRKWFKRYDKLPDQLRPYLASDYAVTDVEDDDAQTPDFTEHGAWSLDTGGNLYATDWWSGQTDPEVWIDAACGMIGRRKPLIWFDEKGVIRRAVNSALEKRLREKQIFVMRHGITSAGSKAERALGFAARASAGTVYLPVTPAGWDVETQGKFWADAVIDQLCSFTGQEGRVDDKVDVCSLIARGLDMMGNAREPANTDPDPIIPFTRRHIESIKRSEREDADAKRRFYR